MNASRLPRPDNFYDCDYAWARIRNSAVSLFFAKASPSRQDKLRTRVEVRFPLEAFYRQFWKVGRSLFENTREQAVKSEWRELAREHESPETMDAEKETSLWASLTFIARGGTEAAIDFYHVPPKSIHLFNQSRDVADVEIEPVLRVGLTMDELLRLYRSSELVAKEVEPILERTKTFAVTGDDDDDDDA